MYVISKDTHARPLPEAFCQARSQSLLFFFFFGIALSVWKVLTVVQKIFHPSSTFRLKMMHKWPLFLF